MVKVEQLNDSTVAINGKHVINDMNGKWIAQEELRPNERRALMDWVNSKNQT